MTHRCFLRALGGTQLTFELEPPVLIDGREISTVHAPADDQAVVARIKSYLATDSTPDEEAAISQASPATPGLASGS